MRVDASIFGVHNDDGVRRVPKWKEGI